MILRLFLIFILTGCLAGCATTQKPTAVNQLQIRVAHLERKLDERDQDLDDLKYEVKELVSQIDGTEMRQVNERIEERDSDVYFDSGKPFSSDFKSKDERIIRVSAKGRDVQRALKNAGYYDGPIDGKIGKKSKGAIKEFQKDHSLKADGIVGKKTWSEMKNYLE